jgi:CRP/FNR family cyclic AMP-dependent transcriptional regulator
VGPDLTRTLGDAIHSHERIAPSSVRIVAGVAHDMPESGFGGGADETTAVVEAIGRSPLFRGVPEPDLATIAPMLRQRRYRAGETIFHEGDPGDAMHVIATGRAKISIESPDGDEAILVTLGPGEVFGELVLLDGAPRSAAAIAVEPTVTYILTSPDFGPLIAGNDAFRTAILHNLAQELRRLTVDVSELHFLDLAGRLASRLARMADEAAPGQRDEVRLGRAYTQTELAAMIGGTRQSVNRVVAELVSEGLLRVEPNDLVVVDVARMAQRARW